jgi:signal transduction histidine kinase
MEELVFPQLVSYMKECYEKNVFVLIGEKKLEVDGHLHYFEIFCRYTECFPEGSEITFLLNDVTRTRENQNLEVKYKTLFLSKVAHEFKNPLICLSELSAQLVESQNQINLTEESKQKIRQIKAMSNFLLVLVKDLNYFAEFEYDKEILIEKREIKLNELISFCQDITHALLRNLNKSKSVQFSIRKFTRLNSFVNDEWRIKQILINFLSNAAKFTYRGYIQLSVEEVLRDDRDFLKFSVEDSGIGMKEENKAKLFKPFSKNSFNENHFGSGLGLFISKEIVTKLEGQIECISEDQEGSIFSVYVPLLNYFTYMLPNRDSSKSIFPRTSTKSINGMDETKKTIELDFLPGKFKEVIGLTTLAIDSKDCKYITYFSYFYS